ncbi:MAG: DUF2400 family protein, partial [Alphaproteobacteria bacterium]|nr:DUF2400 family protein [Alphaproteobacteria bacterium]
MSVRQAQQRWLEGLYAKYHHPRYIEDDPLAFLARWPGVADREVGGLVAALLAFGNVKSIRGGIADLLDRVGPEPRRFVERSSGDDIAAACRGFGYRWVGERQMAALLVGVRGVLAEYGSLAGAFGVSPRGATI